MKPLEDRRNRSNACAKPAPGPARTSLVAALAGLAMALGLAAPAAVVHAHDAKWGTGGVLHDYTLKFCARRDTSDNTHSGKDDYYKVRFDYRWKDVGYVIDHGVHHGYHGVPWLKWGSDADIHVASQYTGEWRCRSAYTKAVLAGHGKSNGHGDFVNGRIVTSDGNTIEFDIDHTVNTLGATSVCVAATFGGVTCIGSWCWGGSWTTSLYANC